MKVDVVSRNKLLAIVLVVMCLVIAVLVGFVIVGFINSKNEQVSDEYVTVVTDPEILRDFEEYDELQAKAEDILSQDPVDVNAVKVLYQDNISAAIENGDLDQAASYVWLENGDLLSKGFEAEALDAMLALDFDAFDEIVQCRFYAMIIALAEDLGRDDVISTYQPLISVVDWAQSSIDIMTERIKSFEPVDAGGDI